MHPLKRSRLALLLFPASLAFCVLLSSTAFGQVVVTPPVITTGGVSATTIIIASLAILVGYVTQGIQSGSLFGVVTIPKPFLPYLGLLGGFLGAFTPSITNATVKDEAAWLTALFAGLIGLGGIVAGVTAKQHIDAHLRDKTPTGSSGRGGAAVDAVTKAASEVTPAAGTPAAKRVFTPTRLLPRLALATAVLAFSLVATTADTGCANNVPTPQTQAEIAASEQLGVCIEQEYVTDATKAPPPAALQIALDIASTCGAEAVDVVGAFTTPAASAAASAVASRGDVAAAAQANAPALHVAAAAYHQKHGG